MPPSISNTIVNLFCLAVLLANRKSRNLNFLCVILGILVDLFLGGLVSIVAYTLWALDYLAAGCMFSLEERGIGWLVLELDSQTFEIAFEKFTHF